MLQKILIATGDSPESAEVFKSGLTLAEKYGAQISILHVLNLFQNGFEVVGTPFIGGTYPMMSDLAIQQYQKERLSWVYGGNVAIAEFSPSLNFNIL